MIMITYATELPNNSVSACHNTFLRLKSDFLMQVIRPSPLSVSHPLHTVHGSSSYLKLLKVELNIRVVGGDEDDVQAKLIVLLLSGRVCKRTAGKSLVVLKRDRYLKVEVELLPNEELHVKQI